MNKIRRLANGLVLNVFPIKAVDLVKTECTASGADTMTVQILLKEKPRSLAKCTADKLVFRIVRIVLLAFQATFRARLHMVMYFWVDEQDTSHLSAAT
jgi:hypothetical protein